MDLFSKLQSVPAAFLHNWGYAILFVAALLEGIPFFGLFVPAQTFLILGGFFARLDMLSFWPVFLLGAIGAVLGDFVAYWLGRKYGKGLLLKHGPKVFFGEQEYLYVKKMLRKHAGKAIIIGRFNTVMRGFTPAVAGATELRFRTVFGYTLISGTLWALTYTLIGYLFGHGYRVAANYLGTFALGAVIVSILFLLLYGRVERFLRKRKHIILRYPIRLWLLVTLSITGFSLIVDDLLEGGRTVLLDVDAARIALHSQTQFLTFIMTWASNLFTPWFVVLISFLLFGWLLKNRQSRTAAVFAISMLFAFLAENLLKIEIARLRPETGIAEALGPSFPSGHATMSAVFCLFLFWAYKDELATMWQKTLLLAGMVTIPLLVGLSRVYLNVHWLSDVAAGWCLGLFALTLTLLIFWVVEKLRLARMMLGLVRSNKKD